MIVSIVIRTYNEAKHLRELLNSITKQNLKIPLLSDESEEICHLFAVIKEKNMYGKKSLGVERSTFLIDDKGVLRQEWRKVKVPGHVEEVLSSI